MLVLASASLLLGALVAGWLAVWTLGWRGGALPPHALGADLLLGLGTVALVSRTRRWRHLLPASLAGAHLLVDLGWVGPPETALGWGTSAVVAGFVLLGGGLLTSWRLARGPEARRAQPAAAG